MESQEGWAKQRAQSAVEDTSGQEPPLVVEDTTHTDIPPATDVTTTMMKMKRSVEASYGEEGIQKQRAWIGCQLLEVVSLMVCQADQRAAKNTQFLCNHCTVTRMQTYIHLQLYTVSYTIHCFHETPNYVFRNLHFCHLSFHHMQAYYLQFLPKGCTERLVQPFSQMSLQPTRLATQLPFSESHRVTPLITF